MKNFKQWFDGLPGEDCDQDTRNFAGAAWNACAAEYSSEIERLKKELHDANNKIQAANLRAQVAERKLKDIVEEIDYLTDVVARMEIVEGKALEYDGAKAREIRQRHKLDEVRNG